MQGAFQPTADARMARLIVGVNAGYIAYCSEFCGEYDPLARCRKHADKLSCKTCPVSCLATYSEHVKQQS